MKKKFWTTFLISLILFSILFAGAGYYISSRNSLAAVDMEDEDDDSRAKEILKEKGEILFLLMGIDDQDGTGGIEVVKAKKIEGENRHNPTGKRTDTMILCKFNFDTGDITMVSIPRDTRVHIRGRNGQEKIAHAHAYGGPYLAIKTVRDLLGIDLNYYVTVDYKAVKTIVDAIGGVEIDVPRRMYYRDPLAKPPLVIDLQPGLQVLDGDKSLQYLRFRSYPEGDVGRVEAQQVFMKEFIKQALQLKNISKIPTMIKTYFDYIDTNIPISVALKAVSVANKVDMENIKTGRIPGEGKYIGSISYYIHDEIGTKSMIEELFPEFIIK